jgi:hypothetical protein
MENATLNDWAALLGFGALVAACIQWGFALVALKFVALSAPPQKRAAWTAAVPFAVVAAFATFNVPIQYAAIAPFVCVPGALINYWYWKWTFVRAWHDDPAMIPENMTVANEDWRVGLAVVLGAIALAAVKYAIRTQG